MNVLCLLGPEVMSVISDEIFFVPPSASVTSPAWLVSVYRKHFQVVYYKTAAGR